MDTKEQTETGADTIKFMNRCWTAGWNEQAFRQYIHPEAGAIVPTNSRKARRAGCLRCRLAGVY